MIHGISEEDSSRIDGELKRAISFSAPYIFHSVEPYYTKYGLKDPDAIAIIKAVDKTMEQMKWENLSAPVKDITIGLAVLVETDNAWRTFLNLFCNNYVKIRGDSRELSIWKESQEI